MLGQPVSMLVPQVVGFKLTGKLTRRRDGDRPGADRDADAAQAGRRRQVRGVLRPGRQRASAGRPRHHQQHGSRVWRDLRHLPGGRGDAALPAAAPAAATSRSRWSRPTTRSRGCSTPRSRPRPSTRPRSRSISRPLSRALPDRSVRRIACCCRMRHELQGATAEPAWTERQQHGVRQWNAGRVRAAIPRWTHRQLRPKECPSRAHYHGQRALRRRLDKYLDHGSVVIAAITSCTNTSNPSVMIAAGLLAKKAVEKGLSVPPWVKTSLAPGSRVVTDYYDNAGLLPYLDKLRFNVVGYGCTTCIGNSGPLPTDVSQIDRRSWSGRGLRAQRQSQLRRPHQFGCARQLPDVATAGGGVCAGRPHRSRLRHRAARQRTQTGSRFTCKDIWPTQKEVAEAVAAMHSRDVPQGVRDGFERRCELAEPAVPDRRHLRVGARFHLHPQGAVLRRHADQAGASQGHSRRARARGAGRLASRRTTFLRPAPSRRTARPGSI